MDERQIRRIALIEAFKEANIEIVKFDIVAMKIFLIVPKEIDVKRVKRLVNHSFGEQLRVFVKEKGEA